MIAIYAVAIVVAFILKIKSFDRIYGTYKDVMPLIIAMPAAYLAFCFQKRSSYMQTLRSLWSHIIEAVQSAYEYTYAPAPTREQYATTLSKLSMAIDEVRGVFCNLDQEKDGIGLYPFEPIKCIRDEIRKLGFGEEVSSEKQKRTRSTINEEWRELRGKFLLEFDRDIPTYPSSKYLIERKG
ncbi:MAG TPA: hypothetical protein VN256_07395 [Pyrinomonadaceae bacterium]|nr:hypothetical protein [Pyrinomonadaceae bacterium]